MNVILACDIVSLGKVGDVVTVKPGYARNFLFPKKMACIATPANVKRIEVQKQKRQAQEEKHLAELRVLAEKISTVSCTVVVEVNDLEKLYGSISEADIARSLEAEGHQIDKKAIAIEKPIEELGIYEVDVVLHPKVIAKLRVWVTKK